MRIESTKDPVKLDKRTYLPFVIKDTCPGCKADYEADLAGSHYLSHPTANAEFDFTCYCHECSHEWTHKLYLQVRLTLAVEYKAGYPVSVPDGACHLCGSFTCNGRCFK
jgi:hypothetical protein